MPQLYPKHKLKIGMYDLYQIMFSQLIDKQFMQLSFFNACFGSFYIYPVKKIHLVTTTEYAFTF